MDALLPYANDPLAFATKVLGFRPDPVQARVLDPLIPQGLLCCTRGWGKTEVTAVSAAHHAATRPNSVALIVSLTAEKAAELGGRSAQRLQQAGVPVRPDGLRRNGWRLENGSRILPVPQRDGSVRGYPATKILVDEAALVSDQVWTALMGTRSSHGDNCSIWCMSTPGARRGFFYELWTKICNEWLRIWVPATECPRIDKKFLEKMRRLLSEPDFEREFMARYVVGSSQFFLEEDIARAIRTDFKALSYERPEWYRYLGDQVLLASGKWTARHGFYVAIDLGQARDYSTIAVLEFVWLPTQRIDPLTRHQHCDLKLRLRWLSRLELHTPYTDVAAILAKVMDHPELQGRCTAIVDATGNRSFLDLVRSMKLPVQGVQITPGLVASTSADGIVNLPKHDIMVNTEALLRLGDLQIASDLPLLPELRKEMNQFERVPLPGGRFSYSGKKQGTGSDDLVMAMALGAGWAWERHRAGFNLAGRLRTDLEVR